MKKTIGITLIAVMLFCFVSCAELVNTETQEVNAAVTDVYYQDEWVQIIWTGKTAVPIMHDATYEVTFTYENVTLTVDDKDIYDYYKDNIGATVKCNLITKYYDDGTISRTLELKEEE